MAVGPRGRPAAAPDLALTARPGLWLMFKLPLAFLKAVPNVGAVLRHEAATTTGERAQISFEEIPGHSGFGMMISPGW